MISPRAVHLLINHFDAIDELVAKRMTRKRPWSEPALTSFLCDLLDAQTQDEENLRYPLSQLNVDLAELDGIVSVSFSIETHEYGPNVERWLTQADIGFVIKFNDNMLPADSWQVAWLLQAKRLYPDRRIPLAYSESSRFGAVDAAQQRRIAKLVHAVGVPFVKYLLYCPRPALLDGIVERKLSHLRNRVLAGSIFDFTLGLELHAELSRRNSSLAAGLFIADADALPSNLGAVHEAILRGCLPLSWFLATHLSPNGNRFLHPGHPGGGPRGSGDPRSSGPDGGKSPEHEWAHGIVTGDDDAVSRLIDVLENDEEIEGPFPFLPPHTITVEVSVGHDIDDNDRRIRRE